METINIDLSDVQNETQLLTKLGEVLELGGAGGNHPISPDSQENGWGMNWDALNDSLSYLDKGGIHGTSRKFIFPLEVHFLASSGLMENDPKAFSKLVDIFNEKQAQYLKDGIKLTVHF